MKASITMKAATNLFLVLTKDFPAPWSVEYHRPMPWDQNRELRNVAVIKAANGEHPLTLETHSGDGDHFNLGSEGAEALVAFVNSVHAELL
jgi:hypothetical protein